MKRRHFFKASAALVAGSATVPLFGQSLMNMNRSGSNFTGQRQLLNELSSQGTSWATGLTLDTPSKIMPITIEAEANTAGYLPADGMQIWRSMAQCECAPNRLAGFQDTGSVWMSNDHGKTWRRPKRSGLLSFQSVGGEIDPLNPDRVFVVTGGSFLTNKPYEGLYLSEDGGLNFSRKIGLKNATSKGIYSAIAAAPSTKDTVFKKTKRWYFFIPGDNTDNIPVYMSDNYGESFTLVRTLSKSAYGKISFARVHPADKNRVYTIGSGDLYCFERADLSTGPVVKLSGQKGLPTGGVYSLPYISADGNVLIVGVSGKGIYKTVNAGDTWTRIGTESSFRKVFVNPWNPDHMILTYGPNDEGYHPKYSIDGGVTFNNPVSVQKRPGFTGEISPTANNTIVAFHPNPGQAFFFGQIKSFFNKNCHYRTDDFGANWTISMAGFSGAQFKTFSSPQMFDPIDKDRLAFPMTDIGVWISSTGGKWFKINTMKKTTLGLSEISQFGCAIHPIASKKTILSLTSASGKQTLCGTFNDGDSWVKLLSDATKSAYVCFDPADPSFAFWDRYKSSDHGVPGSWSLMSSLPSGFASWGASLYDPTGIGLFAINIANYKTICRSTDRGETWPVVLELPHTCGAPGSVWGLVLAHPKSRNILFTLGNPSHTIRKWDLGSGTPATRAFTDLNIFGPGGAPPSIGTPFLLNRMAIDYRYPNVMYASTCYGGSSYRLFRTTNGGSTAWENISDLVPTCCNFNALEVSPVTGDLIVSTSNGTYIIPPPYPQEGTLFSSLGQESYLQNTAWDDNTTSAKKNMIESRKKVKVYPNPTRGLLNIDMGKVYRRIELVIRNVSGKIMQSEKFTEKQIISYALKGPSGVYMLTIVTESLKTSLKIIKD
jgi:hypothetical protein